ncbi:unnamed protein product [Arctogadus glacialis]
MKDHRASEMGAIRRQASLLAELCDCYYVVTPSPPRAKQHRAAAPRKATPSRRPAAPLAGRCKAAPSKHPAAPPPGGRCKATPSSHTEQPRRRPAATRVQTGGADPHRAALRAAQRGVLRSLIQNHRHFTVSKYPQNTEECGTNCDPRTSPGLVGQPGRFIQG